MGRRTNLGLLILLAGAFGTGLLGFAIGSAPDRWVIASHAVFGLAVLALVRPKWRVARPGLARRRRGRGPSIALFVLVATSLLFGVLHSTGIAVSLGPVTSMQVHVGAALAAMPLVLWHLLARRVRPRPTDLSRRALLRGAAVVGGTGVLYLGLEAAVRAAGLPGGSRRFTGSEEVGSFQPETMPVTQWLDDNVSSLTAGGWTLTVRTSSAHRVWSYEEIAAFDDPLSATLDCTGGWYAEQRWDGVLLHRLLPDVAAARSVVVRSATGYARRFPVGDLSRLLLATRLGGAPLEPGHGYPARLVAPGRRGFWWVKWVTEIEAGEQPWWWQAPFPLS